MALTGLLVALLAPVLGQARASRDRVTSHSNLRSHAQVFQMYAGDWEDRLPYFTFPGRDRTTLRCEGTGVTVDALYFEAHNYWNIALADQYYDGASEHESFVSPGVRRVIGPGYAVGESLYQYACDFIAAPKFWERQTRTGPDQWRAVGAYEVVHPAQKGLLIDAGEWFGRLRGEPDVVPLALADGSALSLPFRDLGPQYRLGDGLYRGSAHPMGFLPPLHTLGGAAGRDVQPGRH